MVNNSKIKYQSVDKDKIDAPYTHTWPLTFMTWYVHINEKWRSYASYMCPNLLSQWNDVAMQVYST